MATINNYLPVNDLANDKVQEFDDQIYQPAISIPDLILADNRCSIQQNSDGEDKLCVQKEDTQPLWAIFIPFNGPAYSAKALNFESVDYVGGHPIHKPGSKP